MKINYNVQGKERRKLADEIGAVLNVIPCYLRVPTCAYQIGGCILDRHGVLEIPAEMEHTEIERLLEHLHSCGFGGEKEEYKDVLIISVPADRFIAGIRCRRKADTKDDNLHTAGKRDLRQGGKACGGVRV